MSDYPFVKANSYTVANRGKGDILFVVIHDMEMPEKPTTAEACAAYFARPTCKVSSHFTLDLDSVVQCVRLKDVAWCAPGANSTGVHLEHAGFASQTRGDWLDPFGRRMLANSARLTAQLCDELGIEKRKGDYRDIRAGRPCIVGHADVTRAFPDKGSHTDPEPNFPWEFYIGLVRGETAGTTTTTTTGDDVSFDEKIPKKDGTDRTATAASMLGWVDIRTYRAEKTLARLEAQITGMSAALETLAASKGADSAAIVAEVGTAVRERLAQISVHDDGDSGDPS